MIRPNILFHITKPLILVPYNLEAIVWDYAVDTHHDFGILTKPRSIIYNMYKDIIVYIYIHIHVYIYIYMYIHVYIIYIYIP